MVSLGNQLNRFLSGETDLDISKYDFRLNTKTKTLDLERKWCIFNGLKRWLLSGYGFHEILQTLGEQGVEFSQGSDSKRTCEQLKEILARKKDSYATKGRSPHHLKVTTLFQNVLGKVDEAKEKQEQDFLGGILNEDMKEILPLYGVKVDGPNPREIIDSIYSLIGSLERVDLIIKSVRAMYKQDWDRFVDCIAFASKKENAHVEKVLRGEKKDDLNITELDLHGQRLFCIPKKIERLKGLKKLDCSTNKLKALPESIGNLQNLEELYASGNCLTLPKSIVELKNLKALDCSANLMEALPEDIIELKSLERFSFSYNLLKALPKSIVELKNLKVLNSSNNRLEALPEDIVKLENLEDFWCFNNKLKTLPENIGNLKKLKKFLCHRNQLNRLPESTKQLMGRLEIFQFDDREIKDIPEGVTVLPVPPGLRPSGKVVRL